MPNYQYCGRHGTKWSDRSVGQVHKIIQFKHFDNGILCCIVVSSILMAMQRPQDTTPLDIRVLDFVFTAIFVLEMLLKIADQGCFRHSGSYLRYGWNILDAFVVVTSLISAAFEDYKSLRALRAFRALRPLRLISRCAGVLSLGFSLWQNDQLGLRQRTVGDGCLYS